MTPLLMLMKVVIKSYPPRRPGLSFKLMAARFSHPKGQPFRGRAHQTLFTLSSFICREKLCVWELCKIFNAFELAQYIQGEEELHFAATSSNHDYKYGMHARWECQKNEVKSNQKLKMTTWKHLCRQAAGSLGLKFPKNDHRKKPPPKL